MPHLAVLLLAVTMTSIIHRSQSYEISLPFCVSDPAALLGSNFRTKSLKSNQSVIVHGSENPPELATSKDCTREKELKKSTLDSERGFISVSNVGKVYGTILNEE